MKGEEQQFLEIGIGFWSYIKTQLKLVSHIASVSDRSFVLKHLHGDRGTVDVTRTDKGTIFLLFVFEGLLLTEKLLIILWIKEYLIFFSILKFSAHCLNGPLLDSGRIFGLQEEVLRERMNLERTYRDI